MQAQSDLDGLRTLQQPLMPQTHTTFPPPPSMHPALFDPGRSHPPRPSQLFTDTAAALQRASEREHNHDREQGSRSVRKRQRVMPLQSLPAMPSPGHGSGFVQAGSGSGSSLAAPAGSDGSGSLHSLLMPGRDSPLGRGSGPLPGTLEPVRNSLPTFAASGAPESDRNGEESESDGGGVTVKTGTTAQPRNQTGFIGVRMRKWGMFAAEIRDGEKRRWLGSYPTGGEAGMAYDAASIAQKGHRAKTNFKYTEYATNARNGAATLELVRWDFLPGDSTQPPNLLGDGSMQDSPPMTSTGRPAYDLNAEGLSREVLARHQHSSSRPPFPAGTADTNNSTSSNHPSANPGTGQRPDPFRNAFSRFPPTSGPASAANYVTSHRSDPLRQILSRFTPTPDAAPPAGLSGPGTGLYRSDTLKHMLARFTPAPEPTPAPDPGAAGAAHRLDSPQLTLGRPTPAQGRPSHAQGRPSHAQGPVTADGHAPAHGVQPRTTHGPGHPPARPSRASDPAPAHNPGEAGHSGDRHARPPLAHDRPPPVPHPQTPSAHALARPLPTPHATAPRSPGAGRHRPPGKSSHALARPSPAPGATAAGDPGAARGAPRPSHNPSFAGVPPAPDAAAAHSHGTRLRLGRSRLTLSVTPSPPSPPPAAAHDPRPRHTVAHTPHPARHRSASVPTPGPAVAPDPGSGHRADRYGHAHTHTHPPPRPPPSAEPSSAEVQRVSASSPGPGHGPARVKDPLPTSTALPRDSTAAANPGSGHRPGQPRHTLSTPCAPSPDPTPAANPGTGGGSDHARHTLAAPPPSPHTASAHRPAAAGHPLPGCTLPGRSTAVLAAAAAATPGAGAGSAPAPDPTPGPAPDPTSAVSAELRGALPMEFDEGLLKRMAMSAIKPSPSAASKAPCASASASAQVGCQGRSGDGDVQRTTLAFAHPGATAAAAETETGNSSQSATATPHAAPALAAAAAAPVAAAATAAGPTTAAAAVAMPALSAEAFAASSAALSAAAAAFAAFATSAAAASALARSSAMLTTGAVTTAGPAARTSGRSRKPAREDLRNSNRREYDDFDEFDVEGAAIIADLANGKLTGQPPLARRSARQANPGRSTKVRVWRSESPDPPCAAARRAVIHGSTAGAGLNLAPARTHHKREPVPGGWHKPRVPLPPAVAAHLAAQLQLQELNHHDQQGRDSKRQKRVAASSDSDFDGSDDEEEDPDPDTHRRHHRQRHGSPRESPPESPQGQQHQWHRAKTHCQRGVAGDVGSMRPMKVRHGVLLGVS
ncbi:MAG: hypothetical protein WDW38_002875 [Sanguina aurantia]